MNEAMLKAWAITPRAFDGSGKFSQAELSDAVLALFAERDFYKIGAEASELLVGAEERAQAAEARLAEMEIDRNLWRDGQVAMEARLAEAERENKALREQIGGPEREAFNEALIAFDPTHAGRHYLISAKEMVERAEAAEAKLAAGQAGRVRIGTCECNKSHQCCIDEWQAAEAKLTEAEAHAKNDEAEATSWHDKCRAAEADAKALREALGNLLVWAEWMRKRYRTPDMGEPNTGAIQAAHAAIAGKEGP